MENTKINYKPCQFFFGENIDSEFLSKSIGIFDFQNNNDNNIQPTPKLSL